MTDDLVQVPRTPSRKRGDDGQVVPSPYFSPSKKCRLSTSPYFPNPTCDTRSQPEGSNLADHAEQADPEYADLHARLSLLKPMLIQETVSEDPWKVLVVVTLLNKTAGKLAIPVFTRIMSLWPTPWALSRANESELTELLRPLGCYSIRAKRLISLSTKYLQDPPSLMDMRPSLPRISQEVASGASPSSTAKKKRYPATPISHLPGTGPYALDSYRIFCTVRQDPSSEEWKAVMPSDKELIRYLRWKWASCEQMKWVPGVGAAGPATATYLRTLIAELSLMSSRSPPGHVCNPESEISESHPDPT